MTQRHKHGIRQSDHRCNREQLAFASSAKKAFRFLTNDFGFCITKEEPTLVRYESHAVFVHVYHGRLSYEIGFECGLKDKGEGARYRLPTILRSVLGDDAQDKQVCYQASKRDNIYRCLEKLANQVREHCASLLIGDEFYFTKIGTISDEENRILTEEYSIKSVKRQADRAWIEKDFEEVKSLYESIIEHLTTVEKKRFVYACKHAENKK